MRRATRLTTALTLALLLSAPAHAQEPVGVEPVPDLDDQVEAWPAPVTTPALVVSHEEMGPDWEDSEEGKAIVSLDGAILEDGLHDQLGAGEIGIIGCRMNPVEHGLPRVLIQPAALDLPGEQTCGVVLASLRFLDAAVDQHDVEPGHGRGMGDAGAHHAGAEDANLVELGRRDVFGPGGEVFGAPDAEE